MTVFAGSYAGAYRVGAFMAMAARVGFSRLRLPVGERTPQPGEVLVLFDPKDDFCQFPVLRVYDDGCVDLGPAVAWVEDNHELESVA